MWLLYQLLWQFVALLPDSHRCLRRHAVKGFHHLSIGDDLQGSGRETDGWKTVALQRRFEHLKGSTAVSGRKTWLKPSSGDLTVRLSQKVQPHCATESGPIVQ